MRQRPCMSRMSCCALSSFGVRFVTLTLIGPQNFWIQN
jgi:hypothetical protein